MRQSVLKQFKAQLSGDKMDIQYAIVWRDGETLNAVMSGHVDTRLLGLIGVKKLKVSRSSQIRYSDRDAEVALVLDITGSMAGDKLDMMKSSAKTLLDRIDGMNDMSSAKDRYKVSLVPFSTYVNVGPSNKSQTWMDRQGRSDVNADNLADKVDRIDLIEHLGKDWTGCVQARQYPHDVEDTKPKTSDPKTLFAPMFHPDEPDNQTLYANTYVDDVPTLGTLMTDIGNLEKYGITAGDEARPANWTGVTTQAAYTFYSDQTEDPGPDLFCPTQAIVPLTKDTYKVAQAINKLEVGGSTNITEGLAWGWRTLSPEEPFKGAGSYDSDKREKIAILLSDGNNFMHMRADERGSEFSAYGYLSNGRLNLPTGATNDDIAKELDRRTSEVCTNMKAAGIEIYTIRLELDDKRSETLLRDCASSAENYLNVPDASQLDQAFDELGERISHLYLSK